MAKKSVQHLFPYVPDYMTWEEFNGNLLIQYSQENIHIDTEENWTSVAKGLVQSPTFAAYPTPNTDDFNTWQDWARAFITVINGPSH